MGRRLKELLAQDKLARVFGMGQLCSPKLVEIIGLEGGFDAVWLDHEHAGLSIEQIENAARAARGMGLDSFVRLAPTDYASVMRPLEAGAGGVMAAQVRGVRQAAEVVRWSKFHPLGLRGVNGSGVDGRYGLTPGKEYMEKANDEIFVAIQIEHIDAVNEVEQIAALPQVDVLFIGPADLGQSMGLVSEWNHPRVWEAIERVAKAAQANKVHWAILPPTPDYAKRCLDLGCRMLSMGWDTWTVIRGIRSYKQEFAAFWKL
ncbi:MAG: aldolase/citrate lyase family protein [Gemmataceae bacterium]|nr:aldolase/citrate lyase family protein [Gemmataceae bacterium]MCI0739379.1 aldolase/citrate lyase family protein [Gemmataceae bacterium]